MLPYLRKCREFNKMLNGACVPKGKRARNLYNRCLTAENIFFLLKVVSKIFFIIYYGSLKITNNVRKI